MKRLFIYAPLLLLTFLLSVSPGKVKASHASGGEIVYEWISDSTYRFFFKFYRDCTGILEPTNQSLCFYNNCNSTSFTITMQKWTGSGNGSEVPVSCLGPTKCSVPTSVIPGYREWIYAAIVTMPSQCNDWRIFTYIADRNVTVNLQISLGPTFYVETRMNNVGPYQGNNSPYFAVKPIPYMCVNQPTIFNNAAVDPDGDSLVTEMIIPQNINLTMGCSSTPMDATYITASPAYSIPNNPLQTNNTFTLQATTGIMSFTPTMVGPAGIAIRVKEYRNGILIGSVVRDIQPQVLSCNTPPPPTFTLLSSPSVANGEVYGCPEQLLTFCYAATSTNPNAVLKVYDDHSLQLPGSTANYSGMMTDSVTGCISWMIPPNAFGNYTLQVVVVDSTCNGSLPTYHTFTIPVHIGKTPSITISVAPDTNIGAGATATFTATTTNCSNGTYQWKKNGVDVTGATNSTWITNTISDMDVITCELHCNDSCVSVTDTISNAITMHVFSSVKGLSNVRATELYPNPNNGIFTLAGFAMATAHMQVDIVNMLGQVMWSNQYDLKGGTFRQPVNTSHLDNGMYLLRIKTADGMEIKRMTINK